MIVQCESCQTRFHVADARIPEKGARVRCSRCHHRFHITPSSSAPGAQPSAAPQGSAREPARGEGKRHDDELDNPEFLFDEKDAEDSRPPHAAALDAAADALQQPGKAVAASQAAPPPVSGEPGHGLERSAPEERVVASGGKTAQEMLDAGAPVLEQTRFEIGGALGGKEEPDDTGTGTREFLIEDDGAPARPAKPAGPPARAELDALGRELGEEDDSSFAGWDPLAPQGASAGESAPAAPFFDLASAIAGTPAATATAAPASLFDQPDLAPAAPAKKRAAPEIPFFDPEAAGPAAFVLRVAAVCVGVALLVAAVRALWLRAEADFASPEVVRAGGWIAADVETFVARDDLGERVLVVRGNLHPDGATTPPRVGIRVLDRTGRTLAEAPSAWLERVDDAEVTPEALTPRLVALSGEVAAIGQQVTGFTAVLMDPPPGARRIEVVLEAEPAPPRGTATADVPPANAAPPATPPRSHAQPEPAPTPRDGDVVPAAPDFVD